MEEDEVEDIEEEEEAVEDEEAEDEEDLMDEEDVSILRTQTMFLNGIQYAISFSMMFFRCQSG